MTYYRSLHSRYVVRVISTTDGMVKYNFVDTKPSNSFFVEEEKFYSNHQKLILPKLNDRIILKKNLYNNHSPLANKEFVVHKLDDFAVLISTENGAEIKIKLLRWKWEIVNNSIDISNTNVLKYSTQNKGHKTMEIKVNSMYRSKYGAVVIITKIDGYLIEFINKDKNNSFSLGQDTFKSFYPEEFILPKSGDKIYLTKNRINDNSPHVNKTWTVVSAPSTWVTIQSAFNELINIDLVNWEWNVVKDAPVEHDGLIEKDGKFYVLKEIEQPEYEVGDIINGNFVVVDMKPSIQGWKYHMWDREQSKIKIV